MQPMPPSPQPPPSVNLQGLRPNGWWYSLAGVLGVLGVVVPVVVIVRVVSGIVDKVDDFDRVAIPGGATVQIEDAGDYTIYHEYPGADSNGRSVFDASLDVTLTAPDGSDVELEPYDSEVSYDFGGHEGEALYSFEAAEAGNYELTTTGGPGNAAVGPGIGSDWLVQIGVAVVLALVLIAAAIIVAVVVGVRRGRDRRQRLLQAARPPWSAPPSAIRGPGGFGVPPGPPQGPSAPPGGQWGPPSQPQSPPQQPHETDPPSSPWAPL